MADQFQIPQRSPQYVAPIDPTRLAEAYLDRPTPAQVAGQGLGNAIGGIADYKKYQLSKQLAASEALGKLFESGGPYAVQQYGGPLQNLIGNQQPIPTDQALAPASSPIPPAQPTAPPPQSPDNGISPAIQHSVQNMGAPDFTGHLSRINKLQRQMADVQNMGQYGRNQQQGIGQQITAEKAALDAEQAPLQYAEKQQSLANAQQQIPMEKAKVIAAATAKIAPNMAQVKNLQSAYDQINAVNSSPANKSIPFTGNLGALYASANPTTKSSWAKNQFNAEQIADVGAGAIEKLVEGRYNDEQMKRIKASFFPTGNQLGTPVAKDQLARLQNYITQAREGNIDELKAAVDAIAGGGGNGASLGKPEPFPTSKLPIISSNEEFKALPSGSQFQDPSGQIHRKK